MTPFAALSRSQIQNNQLSSMQPDSKSKISRHEIEQLNEKKTRVSTSLKLLKDKIGNCDAQKLVQELESLKDIETLESESESVRKAQCLKLESKINELHELLQNPDHSLSNFDDDLNQAKQGLAIKQTTVLLLKAQLDGLPSQGELIQYERRLSELNTLIQGKLCQTRQCYATYNALLEMKDLMLKETSLLSSISSQFHNAISSPTGQAQLVSSMQGISQGSQQKLKKIQLDLQAGEKAHDILKEKYAAALLEQRLCKSLLQAFQAECAKNEELRGLAS